MNRPTAVFVVRVCPTYNLLSCPAKLAEEARGVYGCHSFDRCPDCVVTFEGWSFWGENGHHQGSAPTRARLIHWLKLKARETWPCEHGYGPGARMGYRFKWGSSIHYRRN